MALRRYFCDALERSGCTPLGFDDCEAVLGLKAADRPDVIVLDEHAIREEPGSVRVLAACDEARAPIIAVTSSLESRSTLEAQGIDLVIEKPLTDKVLIAAVWSALG